MAEQQSFVNEMEREAVYRIRELCSQGKESALCAADEKEAALIGELSKAALYPEKPFFPSVREKPEDDFGEMEFFRLAGQFMGKKTVQKFITCGGVDDGKSTLIGRILYDVKSRKEQEEIRANPVFLRKDGSVDYALLAGTTEEEARQGITVQVSYSAFERGGSSFLMADVPGHEEYTHNMAYAAAKANTAVIMVAANKGIVPQTRRHTRICYFMGIRSMIFAVNKMDMMSYQESVFRQISEEIVQMMEGYAGCECRIVPAAAKSGKNIIEPAKEMSWYNGGTLLDVLQQADCKTPVKKEYFCMPVQRICKSSQMKGAVVEKRAVQGEVLCGSLTCGDEIFVYPTAKRAKISTLYRLAQKTDTVCAGDPVSIELDRELDTARGYILADRDVLNLTDRVEADLLWTLDNRLTQGKRYQIQIGTAMQTAVVTKICYLVDVNTGDHRYAEYITKNELARCELCFSRQAAVTCEKENRTLGTLRLYDRKTGALAAYGNIIHTISEEVLKRDSREITAPERESCLGQKAGLILFDVKNSCREVMNYIERYLLRMGFHTIQAAFDQIGIKELRHIRSLLDAGLIVLLALQASEKKKVTELLEEGERIFDGMRCTMDEEMGYTLKCVKEWASELI